jgi:hypothetical protein
MIEARRAWILAVIATMAMGCSGAKVSSKGSAQLTNYHVHKVVLIPFETIETPQVLQLDARTLPVPEGALRSDMAVAVPPPTGMFNRPTHLVRPDAGEKVTDLMWEKLNSKPGLELIGPAEATRAARDLSLEPSEKSVSAARIAQRVGADAALTGKVLVYQERVGGRLGANPPAAVGFEVHLVASDGAILWEGNYYEKQQPMTEDFVGFIRRRGMFVTADELAAYGAAELAEDFPYGTAAR